MVKSFNILSGQDGPTSVFYAGKIGDDSFIFVGIAFLAAAIAATVYFLKKRK